MLPEEDLSDLEKDRLYLWCAYPNDVLAEGVAGACAALLSPDECVRWKTFRFERHRREYLATRALVRIALSRYRPISPEAWRFELNAYGKPAAKPDCGLQFNLSNCPGLVVCLIAPGTEVGVDVEPCERAEWIAKLAPEVFSASELAQLEALPDEEKPNRALSLWTLKEAYIKARGMGLQLPLAKFSFLFGGTEGIRLELDPSIGDEPERWRFCLLERTGHRIAIMVERTVNPALQLWEAHPLLSPPTRLPSAEEVWFPRLEEFWPVKRE